MEIPYYPGCTLKAQGLGFETSAIASAKAVDIEMVELERWNCCGTVFSLASDDLMHYVAPIRNFIRVQEAGYDKMVTLCSMCYNTMKRANLLVKNDSEKLKTLNDFMYREEDYKGNVEIVHLLELLRDEIGFETISKKVIRKFNGLKVAPYYGCMLTRPKEVGIDDWEEPQIMENLITALGAEVVDDPMRGECCGAYHTVNSKDLVAERTRLIVTSAKNRGADVIILSCPLCEFNLDTRQKDTVKIYSDFTGIPILYFTQLIALSLGLGKEVCRFDLHYVDPRPLLIEKGIIEEGEDKNAK